MKALIPSIRHTIALARKREVQDRRGLEQEVPGFPTFTEGFCVSDFRGAVSVVYSNNVHPILGDLPRLTSSNMTALHTFIQAMPVVEASRCRMHLTKPQPESVSPVGKPGSEHSCSFSELPKRAGPCRWSASAPRRMSGLSEGRSQSPFGARGRDLSPCSLLLGTTNRHSKAP